MSTGARNPIDLAASFDRIFAAHDRVAVAVSGGTDSVALMHLVAACTSKVIDRVTILTVDHRLRSESAEEASRVGDMARAAGFSRHRILTWEGPHPATGIQAAARDARYRLLGAYCRENGIGALLTAHTRDDQAETVLMRLARGTGVDGLGAMASVRWLDDGIAHHRPLLEVSRADLRSYLQSIGAHWIEDPSNDNPAFERIRWRQARAALDDLGLTDGALALTANRAARAAAALDWATANAVHAAGSRYAWSPLGFAVVSRGWLTTLPSEIRIRVLGTLIEALGGQGSPTPLAALENAVEGLCNLQSPMRRGFTLHGAMVRASGDKITVLREPIGGRRGTPIPQSIAALPITRGQSVRWDRRFDVHLGEAPEGATIRPLGPDGLAALRAAMTPLPPAVPSRVLWALPCLDFPTLGRAVPHLGIWPGGFDPHMVHFGPIIVPFSKHAQDDAASSS